MSDKGEVCLQVLDAKNWRAATMIHNVRRLRAPAGAGLTPDAPSHARAASPLGRNRRSAPAGHVSPPSAPRSMASLTPSPAVLDELVKLLESPEPDHALDQDVAKVCVEDPEGFKKEAAKWTKKWAKK